jgi:DNA-directed RNA polymerase subunit beta
MIKVKRNRSMFVIPDLRQMQLESFRNLLLEILPLELKKLAQIEYNNPQFEFEILSHRYRFEIPRWNEREAIYQSVTYSSNLYIPASLYNTDKHKTQIQTVLLGSLPLMTINGSFIINGISRCIVSQLIRSPGIYYTLSTDGMYIATIITNSGKRLKLKLDLDGAIWVIFHNNTKIPFTVLLLALGLDIEYIPIIFQHWIFDLDEEIPVSIEEAIKLIHSILKPNISKPHVILGMKSCLYTFSNILLHEYELGPIGRLNLNKKLGLNASENEFFLCLDDFLVAAFHLLKVSNGTEYLDDIDDLKHKRVRRAADIIYDQVSISFNIFKKKIQHTFNRKALNKRSLTPSYLFYIAPLSLERFLSSYELSQFLDQTNPLADIVHKRKLSSLGPGGLTPRTARFRVRDIHPSQYGRICPIETAEGQNAGIVTSFTTSAQIDKLGQIQNLVYEISSNSMKGTAIYMIANDDEYSRIATGRCLTTTIQADSINLTPVQHRRELVTMSWDEVNLRIIFPLHYFSIGVALIPFLEHNDSTRALMGSNMQRQAVTLVKREKAIVGTGIEGQIGLDAGSILIAPESGCIQYVDAGKIVLCGISNADLWEINLATYARLNNNICMYQKPAVQKNEYIRQGQLIADSNATVGGELALGKNVLVAYMPWEGYNFEDAILINERLVYDNTFTSIHIERYDTEIRITHDSVETLTNNIPHLNKYRLRHLDNTGLVKIGTWVETGDVLVGKIVMKQSEDPIYGPESRLLQEIFGIEAITTHENCLKVPLRGGGRVIDVRCFNYENGAFGQVNIIQVYILRERAIKVGDKLAGRHGNKGVVSKILPREDMPYLPDGTPVDMVLSPLGVPSRMNVGQVFECLLGLTGTFLDTNYRILPFDERYEMDASRKLILSELHKASQKMKYPWLFEATTPGKIRLFDGRTGDLFDQPVTVGKAYMFKLIHQVDDKIHARSTGPYAIVTQQPVRGKSRQGGQRVGEMEVWAFQGFGASYALQELLTTKSDHIASRGKVLNTIVRGKPILYSTSPSDCLRGLIRELWSLGINLNQTFISQYNGTNYQTEL